jgi:hypothetical protein
MSIENLKKTVLIEYVARAESVLKANAEMREARAKMTAEERKAADEARAAAKDREEAYRGVVAQMKAEEERGRAIQKMIDDVSATEKKAASARKDSHRDWLADLAHIGQAYNTIKTLGQGALEDIEFAAKRARSEHAALGVDMDKLSDSAHGLQTQTTLLEDAGRMNNSMVAMTAEQMQIAERAIVHFTRAGFDNAHAHDAVLKSITTLKTDGLDELGIHIDKSGLSMDSGRDRATLFRREMKALADVSKDVKDGQDEAGEATERSATKLKDAWDSVKVSLGQLAESLVPLVDALAKIVGYVAKIVDDARKGAENGENGGWIEGLMTLGLGSAGQYAGRALGQANNRGVLTAKNIAGGASTLMATTGFADMQNVAAKAFGVDGDIKGWFGDLKNIAAEMLGDAKATTEAAKSVATGAPKKRATPDGEGSAAELYDQNKQIVEMWLTMLKSEFVDPVARFGNTQKDAFTGNAGLGYGEYGFSSWDPEELDAMKQQFQMTYVEPLKGLIGDAAAQFGSALSPSGVRTPTILERMFGKRDEFDIYKEAWGALSSTISGAYDAIVSGGDSVGKSIKKVFASSLEALGKKMFIEGIEYEFEAIAERDPSKAIAGAGLIAGSVAAGVAAHELGAGGGGDSGGKPSAGSGGGGGGGARAPSGGGGAPAGPSGAVIVVGDSFADDSYRMRQLKAKRLVQLAGLSGGGVSDE